MKSVETLQLDDGGRYRFKPGHDTNMREQQIPFGFICNFGNAVGRTAIQQLLDQAFGTSTIVSVNVGGSSCVNDMPSVREIMYEVIGETAGSSGEGSSSSGAEEVKTFSKSFTPDVLLDHFNVELLCVEIKKGDLKSTDLAQLQYLLLPPTMSYGTALGLLFSTERAILVKGTKSDHMKCVMFQTFDHLLQPESLSSDMEELLVHIYCHLKSQHPQIIK